MANDVFIWNKLKTGDKQSYELIFKMYYPQLCLFANKFTKDFDLAREVVQDLFVYLWENKHTLHNKSSIKSYLFAAVRFNSIRRFNSQGRKTNIIKDIPEDALEINFFDEIEYAELQEVVYTTIESLSPQCKKIFKMSRFDNMTYSKIAKALNISQKTVEAHMTKALKTIQKSLDDYLLLMIILFFIQY